MYICIISESKIITANTIFVFILLENYYNLEPIKNSIIRKLEDVIRHNELKTILNGKATSI